MCCLREKSITVCSVVVPLMCFVILSWLAGEVPRGNLHVACSSTDEKTIVEPLAVGSVAANLHETQCTVNTTCRQGVCAQCAATVRI